MKYITFTVPCYNSAKYMNHAIDTILTAGEDVEIIIVDDGSTDDTGRIADAYAAEYPDIIRVIHKENGGHGSGVNTGIANATGLYFKVVDSDDWVSEKSLKELLCVIKAHVEKSVEADLYITNYVYDHVLDNKKCVRHWKKQLPVNVFTDWENVKPFFAAQVMMMHSLLYKTELLRLSNTVLPEHTFYVDNIYAYKPLPYMKRIYYIDTNLYHYFIGRDDQSVNINNMVKRYDQQVRVMCEMLKCYTFDEITAMEPGLTKYMLHVVSAVMMVTMMFCCSGGDDEQRRRLYDQMWSDLQAQDLQMYEYLQHKGLPAIVTWMPWRVRGKSMLIGYKALCKIVKLG